eukprot:g24929.t1
MARGSHGHGYLTFDKVKTSHWKIFRRTLPFLWPKGQPWMRFQVVLSFIFLLLSQLTQIGQPFALKKCVDDLFQGKLPVAGVVLYAVFNFGSQFCKSLQSVAYARVSASMEQQISLDSFTHVQNLTLGWHLKRKTGSVLRSLSRGASSFATLLRLCVFQLGPTLVQVLITAVLLLFRYQWWFSAILLGDVLLYFALTYAVTEWRNKYRRRQNTLDNDFNAKSADALLNFETVKYFNAEQHEAKRYADALQLYTQANIATEMSLAVLDIGQGQGLVIAIGLLAAMFLSAQQVVAGRMTAGDWVLVHAFLLQLFRPLNFLGAFYSMIKQAIVDVENMFELMEEPIEIRDVPDAPELHLTQGEVRFENVSFSYTPDMPILRKVSFTIPAGRSLAIVGPSGAGKSTLARLLYRFFEVSSGRILVDGQDIAQVKQSSLRKHIGIVPQDTVLFNDTIGYNIGYGIYARETEAPLRAVQEAAKSAALYNFIQESKDGFETIVGERGLRLSGGEKQRVAIARAILKAPEIMIFDEATSSLDTLTEKEIMGSLEEVGKNRTSLTIAHRLSTIMKCDSILVLKHGKVVEQGSHAQLIALNGEYKQLWDRQQHEESLKSELAQLLETEQKEQKQQLPVPAAASRGPSAPAAQPFHTGGHGHGHGQLQETKQKLQQVPVAAAASRGFSEPTAQAFHTRPGGAGYGQAGTPPQARDSRLGVQVYPAGDKSSSNRKVKATRGSSGGGGKTGNGLDDFGNTLSEPLVAAGQLSDEIDE